MSTRQRAAIRHNRIGICIRDLRREQGITLGTLATAAGITESHLSRIERGLASPSCWVVAALAAQLGVKLSEFAAFARSGDAAEHPLRRMYASTEAAAWSASIPAANPDHAIDLDLIRSEARQRYQSLGFTRREGELADILLSGVTSSEAIGAALGIQTQTVKNILKGMHRKAGVTDRVQLVLRLTGLYDPAIHSRGPAPTLRAR
jgi:DNA-binding CsgD family transcriptional regulator/DNA-binding XRE family transcriptional regulator